MPSVALRSFAGGEISTTLSARSDQVKYQTGLRTCRNCVVTKSGAVRNRPGTRFVCEVKDSTKAVRLVRFAFNEDQTYVLEFGDGYMRVIQNGVLLESGGLPYEIVTPYAEADLADLQYIQSGDVVTIVHQNYAPSELRRTGHTSWTLSEITFEPGIAGPAGGAGTRGNSGSQVFRYRVTAVKANTYEESLPGLEATKVISGATKANPVVITSTAHGYANNGEVYITGVVGMTQLNGRTFTIANVTTDTFKLQGIDGTGYSTYVSGGTAARTYIRIGSAGTPTAANPNVVTWTAVAGAVEYNVYKEKNGVYGFVATTATTQFDDENVAPDIADTPPLARNPFPDDDFPGTVGYLQQRQVFACSPAYPERVWLSKTGDFHNFTIRSPIQDDDAVTFTVAGRRVNAIRHLIEIGKLVVLTSGGEWTCEGDGDGVVRPNAINLRQQGHNGAANLSPIITGNTALFVQARGGIVRDLRYELQSDGYTGQDLTVFAEHLFAGRTLVDWDYQQIPGSIVWAVRDDGTLLGLTYLREHEIWAWHRHDTAGGTIENVCCVPEGDEDAVYLVVKRTIDGSDVRYIERLESRMVDDVAADAFFVDSGLTYDGENTTTRWMKVVRSGDTGPWTMGTTLKLYAGGLAYWTTPDVGKKVVVRVDDHQVVLTIGSLNGSSPASEAFVTADRDIPEAIRDVQTTDWARLVDEVSGLDHLEGETVAILADGFVEPPQVVTDGAITLSRSYAIIHAGLPIIADFETLDLDDPQNETLMDKRKRINKVTLMVESSRGIWAGPDSASLVEYMQRSSEGYDAPPALKTGNVEVLIPSNWSLSARVFVRQSDPLPLTILAAIPSVTVGG